jgi:DNA-binding NarL/FixJ family response regulator
LTAVRILIADDFAAWRGCIVTLLATIPEFHIVGEAADGLEAVRKTQELQPDLILLDIGMPKLNGIEAARQICVAAPGVIILFVSENRCRDVIREALGTGRCTRGYVLKSAAASDLLPAMQAVLQRGTFLSGDLAQGYIDLG